VADREALGLGLVEDRRLLVKGAGDLPYRNTCALQKHLDEHEEKQEGHQGKPELIHRGNQRRIHVHDLIRSNRDRSACGHRWRHQGRFRPPLRVALSARRFRGG
jgi:hypothetical protein